jgi:hypothetical protein
LITTPDLIDSLAEQAAPVRRLRPPLQRMGLWVVVVLLLLILFTIFHGVRPDLLVRLQQPTFSLSVIGALMTGILAALAAFQLSLPDRSAQWLWLPVPAVLLWASTIGYGCLINWISLAPDGIRLGTTLRCFGTLVLTSVPLSLVLLVMLRHAAPLRPTVVAMSGGLAVAGITATALSVFHDIDATIMVLLWNFGTAALIVLVGGAFGRRLFAWGARRPRLDRGAQ